MNSRHSVLTSGDIPGGRGKQGWRGQISRSPLVALSGRFEEGRAFSVLPYFQTSTCSEIAKASSTSMPRYLTVLSILVCPSSNWTARRLPVRR